MGTIRVSKVDKGIEIQWSELTYSHEILDMHEPHSMFIYLFCNLKTAPLVKFIANFALKNASNSFGSFCARTTFGKNHINAKKSCLVL